MYLVLLYTLWHPLSTLKLMRGRGNHINKGGGQEHDGENHRDKRPKLVEAHRLGTDSWETFMVPN